MNSSYVDGLQKEVLSPVFRHPAGDAIYASWNQCSTGTGRLASADPNMQTLPKVGMERNEKRREEKSDDGLLLNGLLLLLIEECGKVRRAWCTNSTLF